MPRTRTRRNAKPMTVAKDVELKQGKVIIHKEESEVSKEKVNIGDVEHPAYVEVTDGITRNLGDFNSLRVGVMVRMPCPPTKQAIHNTYHDVSDMVQNFLDEELDTALDKI